MAIVADSTHPGAAEQGEGPMSSRVEARPASPEFPAFFVVGVGRSGTTLARAILTGHPDLCVPPETGFLPTLLRLRPVWWGSDGLRAGLFTRLVFANGRLRRAGLTPDRLHELLSARPPGTPAESVTRIYEMFLEADGAQRVGDKTPSYVEHVPQLSGAFPSAQFIHMVRHPLDTVASLLRQPWGPSDPLAAGWLWLRSVRRCSRAGLPADRLLVVRLEDLIADPTASVRRMSDHLGVRMHPDMLRFSERAEQIQQQNIHPEGHAGLSGPLAPTRHWEQELDAVDAARTWSLVAVEARRLGYDVPGVAECAVDERVAARRLAQFRVGRSWRRGKTLARMFH
jgi:Sulfotransferase family